MTKSNKELSIQQEVTRDCPILFRMRCRSMSESCMVWGFECGEGWHSIIASACRELEMLNIAYYQKYRVRIQADQIKEKFGTLRFYYSIVQDPNCFLTWLGHKFEHICDYFSDCKKFDYALKKIVDVEPFDYDNREEITKDKYDKYMHDKYKPLNVEYVQENEKYFEVCHLRNYGKFHMVPTKHKFAWSVKNLCNKLSRYFLYLTPIKDTAAIRNCIELMNRKAEKIVREAEAECEKHCEDCGNQIGTKWSPSCQTTGWISYICEDCAKKKNGTYIKNGELWQNDKMLKSKEELAKDYEYLEELI